MYSQTAMMFYSRPEIQKAILSFAKNRELGPCFDGFYGKRPDVIEYISDVKSLVAKKIFSFHFSEERWANPLLLANPNLSEEERAKNRIGWDLILDLDGVDFFYAKIVGKIIIDYLDEIGVKNVSVKFSGNKGFHIGVPFEAFSSEFIGYGETRNLFPQAAHKIASYLMFELRGKITDAILKNDGSVENISKKYNIPVPDLMMKRDGKHEFDYMKVIEVDTILITSRHLFRAPYSFNEKSELISIPIEPKRIMEFDKKEAKPANVNPDKYRDFEFLRYNPEFGKDGDKLLIRAYEADVDIEFLIRDDDTERWDKAHHKKMRTDKEKKIVSMGDVEYSTFDIEEEIDRGDFPRTIEFILNNDFADGKKRALFVLLTFLYAVNWKKQSIESLISEWNSTQSAPLKDNYISAQISWFESQDKKISTPNFDNENYYKSIGIPFDVIKEDMSKFKEKVKSPLHFIALKVEYDKKLESDKKRKKKEKKK